jgi:hypothetical protein
MRLLICGSHRHSATLAIEAALDAHPSAALIHGDAPGVDREAGRIARLRGRRVLPFPADWSQGRIAGPQRNERMIDVGRPDIVVAFPCPRSVGTHHLIRYALASPGVSAVYVLRLDGEGNLRHPLATEKR